MQGNDDTLLYFKYIFIHDECAGKKSSGKSQRLPFDMEKKERKPHKIHKFVVSVIRSERHRSCETAIKRMNAFRFYFLYYS